MSIIGIESLVYGVEEKDFADSVRFFEDFGLPLLKLSEDVATFRLPEGSHVCIRKLDDPWFLPSKQLGTGVRECIWGVESQASFDDLLADLRRDHEVQVDPDGTARFVTAFGQAVGLKVWRKLPVHTAPTPFNSPGNINRVNQMRKWIRRAIPTNIHHVVWAFPDVNQVLDFYRDRLGFRLTEVQIGAGVYVRASGAPDHHNIFIADASNQALGFDGSISFHHANYGVEDIDELMIGKNYMERRGWPRSSWGMGRHRISSGAFLYLKCPAGGEAEYGADIDAVDDRWVPHVWEARFGSNIFIHDLPVFLQEEVQWDVRYCEPDARYPEATATVSECDGLQLKPAVIMA